MPKYETAKYTAAPDAAIIKSAITSFAEEPVAFDEDTYCNMSPERVREILADENVVKFIDIARYYVEKGLDRLVEAFQTLSSERGDVCLIIIGGHGDCHIAEHVKTAFEKLRRVKHNPLGAVF